MLAAALGTLLLTIGSYVIGLAGIALAVVFYVRSRKFKRMSFVARSFDLLSHSVTSLADFAATYKGRALSVLTATKVLIWNSGSEVLCASDVAETDAVRLSLPEGFTILDARVVASSAGANQARVTVATSHANETHLSFEYFGPKEGCLISVLHTGPDDADIKVKGTIKGAGSPMDHGRSRSVVSEILWRLLPIMIVVSPASFAGGYLGAKASAFSALFPLSLVLYAIYLVLLERYRGRMTGHVLDSKFRNAFSASELL